jgi:hypothetical protein
MIEGHKKLKTYITNYHKGVSEKGNFSMDESRTEDILQVFERKIAYLQHLILSMK